MIKKYESFVSEYDHDYDHEDLVVSKHTGNGLIKGRRYIVQEIFDDYILVKDISNNQPFYRYKDAFMTEVEYEMGDNLKKYNI